VILPPIGTIVYVNINTAHADDWKIASCKVGQADANLVRTGENSAIVIDVGQDPSKMSECLSTFGVKQVDLLVLTHFHSDHVDGINGLTNKVPVQKAFVSKVQPNTRDVKNTLSDLNAHNISYTTVDVGNEGVIENGDYKINYLVISSISPSNPNSLNSLSAAKLDDAENNSSVSLFVNINYKSEHISAVFLGDLELEGQKSAYKYLVEKNIKNVDVLKVAHHGSKTQYEDLAKLLHPKVAIYCVGVNTFGHPNEKTVKMFEDLGAISLSTFNSNVGVMSIKNGSFATFSL
jgi:competence protein ComEC